MIFFTYVSCINKLCAYMNKLLNSFSYEITIMVF